MTPLRAISTSSLLAASLGLGCFSWEPLARDQSLPDPELVVASGAIHLDPGVSSEGKLDCKAGRCDQWFRVRLHRAAVLRVEARVEGLAEKAVARLFLQDVSGKILAEARSSEGLPLRVEQAVEPGHYAVLLQAGGGPVSYAVEGVFEETTAPSLQPGSSGSSPLQDGAMDRLARECFATLEARRYVDEVKYAIFRQWAAPAGAAPAQTVDLGLRIAASGGLLEATPAAGAESPLAASALRAVHQAAPFRPMSSVTRCLAGITLNVSFRN